MYNRRYCILKYITIPLCCRSTILTFSPGQTYHRVVVEVINDYTPELDELFSVQLVNPVGGAVLGIQSSLTITVLTNDDAYGLIGFAEVSVVPTYIC